MSNPLPGFLALLLSLPLCALAQTELSENIDTLLEEAAESGTFAGSVLVRRGERTLLAKAYGLADREAEVPFRLDTVSSLGSLTKQFTGAAVMRLHEAGELSLEDRLDRFFPSVSPEKAAITVHQLLIHAAGLPDALGPDETFVPRDSYLEMVWDTDLVFAPGSRHEYSNVGYSVLAAVIEKVTGAAYEEHLRRTFFAPLGMADTGYFGPAWDLGRVARGYRGSGNARVLESQDAARGFSWHLVGNGGIHSTVLDVGRWLDALLGGRVLSRPSLETLFGEHIDEGGGDSFYGYGWVTFHLDGERRMIGHNGGNGFYFADVNIFPDEDLYYVVLVNDLMRSSRFSDRIRDLILESRP